MTEIKIKGKRTFNYRIGTKKYDENERWFDIIEVYYTDGVPTDYYPDMSFMFKCESVEVLKNQVTRLLGVFDKPIINLDDFPNEFIETTDS